MKGPDRHATDETRRTATCAVLAGLPGLVLSALAALGSTSLALRVDLLLTLLDMVALAAAQAFACRGPRDPVRGAPAELLVTALVAACMILSMLGVAACALHRALWGAPPIAGAGLLVGLGLSLVFGAVNLRLLALWRNRARRDPGSAFLRSQMRLFADKVCSNLLLVVALLLMLGLDGEPGCRFIDPAASLVMIVVSACWAWSMACRVLRDGGTALKPPARTGI